MAFWGMTHDVRISAALRERRRASMPIYETDLGAAYCGDSLKLLKSRAFEARKGKVQLAFTSPPFPLNTKKSYGNKQGEDYIRWFASFAPLLRDMVTEDGSIVVEIGNAWVPGEPVMATHVIEAFLRFLKKGGLHLCQEFIWYNPARLPSPIQWVNRERVRVKDAFTRIWWMSPTTRPKADNRKVLREYSPSMKRLIETGKYNAGPRPSEHHIGAVSFKTDNSGAIPPNVGGAEAVPSLDGMVTPQGFAEYLEETTNLLKAANTLSNDDYRKFCLDHGAPVHPARMPSTLVEFFVKFLTDEGDTVLDPFAGSNTTGSVAQSLGRRWLSVEADWIYAAHSIGRFDPQVVASTCDEISIREREAAKLSEADADSLSPAVELPPVVS
ncbi:MAG: site-specific DNA-methyltransferase [Methylobacterium sp.]|nr:site-specific DNA-methyltransferase [Methylobacterium sp.]MCA3672596.1 site-specific DNA-methyltransferase [Methylobacterium sp.]MCA3676681.1 site-specific DNA-methyltransferase [Methylobacterium sp.]MCA3681117.1 site-specific DNA-methyltransferase [Methylobacterium sp.]MCA3682779.1 site-specific DNA-methyltransferase [Methylobacterium sp.]